MFELRVDTNPCCLHRVSIFYLVGLFDLWDGLRTVLFASGGAYAIAFFLRGSPYMPWVGFVFLMGHMSMNQLERQFANNPAAVDITGAQMVLVMKLSAFCWNVADGTLSDDQLSDFQKDRVLSELPSFLDYAGWVFFFPSLLAGPAMDFAEYRRWLDTSMFDVPSTVDAARKPPTRKKRRIPRSATPALWKLAQGLGYLLLFLASSGSYNSGLLVSDSYLEHGLLKRVWIMYATNLAARMKYYGVWSMTEGACILSGIGYNGVDPVTGKIAWDRATNINPLGVELAQNTRAYLGNWNIKTNTWLRNYVYLRVTPMGKKPGFRASLATFTTSAIWHGFYPGYYMTFVLASFVQTVAKSTIFLLLNQCFPDIQIPKANMRGQTFAGTSAPSSSTRRPKNQPPTRSTTTSSASSSRRPPSRSSQRPSSCWASRTALRSGRGCTSIPLWAWSCRRPSSPARPRPF